VASVYGIDPSVALLRRAGWYPAARAELVEASAEIIPFDDNVFDTVVTTWTLCTIPQVISALREMRRVLRRDGCLLFVEHGLAPDRGVAWWQHRLTPCWKCLGGGCHLNRKIDDLVTALRSQIHQLSRSIDRFGSRIVVEEPHQQPKEVKRDEKGAGTRRPRAQQRKRR
jgi:ubiquinone/menaquinone biosynthesis C-methylase UbiE